MQMLRKESKMKKHFVIPSILLLFAIFTFSAIAQVNASFDSQVYPPPQNQNSLEVWLDPANIEVIGSPKYMRVNSKDQLFIETSNGNLLIIDKKGRILKRRKIGYYHGLTVDQNDNIYLFIHNKVFVMSPEFVLIKTFTLGKNFNSYYSKFFPLVDHKGNIFIISSQTALVSGGEKRNKILHLNPDGLKVKSWSVQVKLPQVKGHLDNFRTTPEGNILAVERTQNNVWEFNKHGEVIKKFSINKNFLQSSRWLNFDPIGRLVAYDSSSKKFYSLIEMVTCYQTLLQSFHTMIRLTLAVLLQILLEISSFITMRIR